MVLAVPVAAGSSLEAVQRVADEVVCLATPEPFYAGEALAGSASYLFLRRVLCSP